MNPGLKIAGVMATLAIAAFAQAPSIATGGVVNGASYAAPATPGSLVSIFGSNLATSLSQADSVPLATSLGGVSVSVNNVPAPLLFVSTGQINAQLPWEVSGSSAQLVVTRGGTASAAVTVPLSTATPGVFSLNFGTGQAVAYGNADGAFAAAAGAIPGANSHPAKIGDPTTLVILATGLGPVNPAVRTGAVVTDGQLHTCVTAPEVLVGGVPAQVVFAGMTPQFVGVYQINIVIAAGTPTGNSVPLQVRMNGTTTTDKITIAVSN